MVGSVSANAPILSSVAIAGSQRCFCSSLPSRWIEPIARPDCTPKNVLTLPSPRDISSGDQPGGQRRQAGAAVALDRAADDAELGDLGTSVNGNSARSQ